MIKIIATSDNHGYIDPINEILKNHSNADFYLHMGDVCCNPKLIRPFVAVRGNNDYDYDLPDYKVIEVNDKNRIFMAHSHQYIFNKQRMIDEAKENKCNIILYGHTHVFSDSIVDGIRMINPGSCLYNRDHSKPCYAEITIDDKGEIQANKIELTSFFY